MNMVNNKVGFMATLAVSAIGRHGNPVGFLFIQDGLKYCLQPEGLLVYLTLPCVLVLVRVLKLLSS